jgi:hypothetical protein
MVARRLRFALAGLVLLSPQIAKAADFVIAEARGIALRVGQTVDSAKPLALRAGQHVTLITPAGATLKLDGPYDKPPDADQAKGVSVREVIAAMLNQRRSQPEGRVPTRGIGAAILPEPWVLDASRTGTVCLREGTQAVLWRPDSTTAASLTVAPADRSWKIDMNWAAGENRMTLPAQVPLRTGANYVVSLNTIASSLTVIAVPAVLTSDDMRLAWLLARDCSSQAEALLRLH